MARAEATPNIDATIVFLRIFEVRSSKRNAKESVAVSPIFTPAYERRLAGPALSSPNVDRFGALRWRSSGEIRGAVFSSRIILPSARRDYEIVRYSVAQLDLGATKNVQIYFLTIQLSLFSIGGMGGFSAGIEILFVYNPPSD